jgi:hypothetical protein
MSPFDNQFIKDPSLLGTFSLRTTTVLPFTPLPEPHSRRSDVAVVTWVAGEAAYRWFSITGPAMKRYADRVGADFVVLDGFGGQPYLLANKFRVRQVLTQYGYEAVLFVDADALIQDHCLDFFSLIPQGHIGMLDETALYDEWMLAQYRREALALVASQNGRLNGDEVASPRNSGLYYLPASLADVLVAPLDPFPICGRNGATVEQTWTSLQVARSSAPVFELCYPLHHWVWYADQSENLAKNAMVLHFAGLGDSPEARYRRLKHYAEARDVRHQSPNRVVDGRELVPPGHFDRQLMLEAPAPPALNIRLLRRIGTHRYGWDVAAKSLSVLENSDGVLFDDFVESTFLWHGEESFTAGIVPYNEHWVGFIHNPPNSPDWPSITGERVTNLSKSVFWRDSLEYCLGLFALTEYLARWVSKEWGVPCEVVRYPTIRPKKLFSWDWFESEKSVVSIGFWLRRFSSFDHLHAEGFRKVRPLPMSQDNQAAMARLAAYEQEERLHARFDGQPGQPVQVCDRLSANEYDEVLSRSIVFLDLIDASAVTTIVECLVRGTPLLINRLEPVEEYLGHDYPFYFDSLEEAAEKLRDSGLILRTHRHMLENPILDDLTPQAFLNSVASTATYQRALQSSARRRRTGR